MHKSGNSERHLPPYPANRSRLQRFSSTSPIILNSRTPPRTTPSPEKFSRRMRIAVHWVEGNAADTYRPKTDGLGEQDLQATPGHSSGGDEGCFFPRLIRDLVIIQCAGMVLP